MAHSASTAKSAGEKDSWTKIDSWLEAKFGQAVPQFERNTDTLSFLQKLVKADDEAAVERRCLLAKVDRAACEEIKAADIRGSLSPFSIHDDLEIFQEDLAAGLCDELTRDSKQVLDSLASASVQLGLPRPGTIALGRGVIALQTQLFDLDQGLARVDIIQQHIDAETKKADILLASLSGSEGQTYHAAPHIEEETINAKCKIEDLTAQLSILHTGKSQVENNVVSVPSIDEIAELGTHVAQLRADEQRMQAEVAEYDGVRPDIDYTREMLKVLHGELEDLTQERDLMFDQLVERETPRKPRR